jgi:hypothetical protein
LVRVTGMQLGAMIRIISLTKIKRCDYIAIQITRKFTPKIFYQDTKIAKCLYRDCSIHYLVVECTKNCYQKRDVEQTSICVL